MNDLPKYERIREGSNSFEIAFNSSIDAINFIKSLYTDFNKLSLKMTTSTFIDIDKPPVVSYWVSINGSSEDIIKKAQYYAKEFRGKKGGGIVAIQSYYNRTDGKLHLVGSAKNIDNIKAFVQDISPIKEVFSIKVYEFPKDEIRDPEVELCIYFTKDIDPWGIVKSYVEKHGIRIFISESLKLHMIN